MNILRIASLIVKTIVIDSYQQADAVRRKFNSHIWNQANTPISAANSFKAAMAGSMAPRTKLLREVLTDRIWELKRVGVGPIIIGHTKKSEITDL